MLAVAAVSGPFTVSLQPMGPGLYRASVMCQTCRQMHPLQIREGDTSHGIICPKCGASGMVRFS